MSDQRIGTATMCLTAATLPYGWVACGTRPTLAGMGEAWDPDAAGVLTLPSGRRVRGRGLREALPRGAGPRAAGAAAAGAGAGAGCVPAGPPAGAAAVGEPLGPVAGLPAARRP